MGEAGVNVEVFNWGKGGEYKRILIQNNLGYKVGILSLGAAIHSFEFPQGNNQSISRDVVLGFETEDGYNGTDNSFFWGTCGRLTNRVKAGRINLDGVSHQLSLNDFGTSFRNHVHGGNLSFDKVNWKTQLTKEGDGVTFSLLSAHSSEGYPGNLIACVTYRLGREDGSLSIDMQAVTDEATVVNLSNHAYFNLAGHAAGWEKLQEHVLLIPHDKYTPDDEEYLPTGEIYPVAGTEYDFTREKLLLTAVPSARGGEGYCVNYCIQQQQEQQQQRQSQLCLAAVLKHPATGRKLEVWSDQPGLELYTGNFLPEVEGLTGKSGSAYRKWGGVCCMTQNYRDAPNHQNFPSAVLRPGETYNHSVVYKFSLENTL